MSKNFYTVVRLSALTLASGSTVFFSGIGFLALIQLALEVVNGNCLEFWAPAISLLLLFMVAVVPLGLCARWLWEKTVLARGTLDRIFVKLPAFVGGLLGFAFLGGLSSCWLFISAITAAEFIDGTWGEALPALGSLALGAVLAVPFGFGSRWLWPKMSLSSGGKVRLALLSFLPVAIATTIGMVLSLAMGMADSPGADHSSGQSALWITYVPFTLEQVALGPTLVETASRVFMVAICPRSSGCVC